MNPKTLTLALLSLLMFLGCAAKQAPISPTALVGEWTVAQIDGAPVTEPGTAFLGFAEDGSVYGNTSVNNLLGGWALEGDALKLDKLGSTRMAGPPELMAQETKLLEALNRTVRVALDDKGGLTLLAADGKAVIAATRRAK